MKHRNTIAVVTVCAACLVIAAFGCSRTKTITTDEGEVTIDKKGNVLSIKTDKGTMTLSEKGMNIQTDEGNAVASFGDKAKLPDNLSNDVPVYKPSFVTMSQVLGDGEKVMVGLSTKDDSSKVADFYKSSLKDKGWNIGNVLNMGPMTMLQGKKGEQKINVTIGTDDEGTSISLAYSEK